MILGILAFIGTFLILILTHEAGHFYFARKFGMRVNEFGFGFPPRIFGINKGNTVYSINAVPLGGFVQIKGEDGDHPDDSDSFENKSAFKRGVVLLAGVVVNYFLAIALFTFLFIYGAPVSGMPKEGLGKFAKIKNQSTLVSGVLENYPARDSGIKSGDAIISIDGVNTETPDKAHMELTKNPTAPHSIKIKRGQKEIDFKITPVKLKEINDYGIGVELASVAEISYPWYVAPYYSVKLSFGLIGEVPGAVKEIIRAVGQRRTTEGVVAGPVGIARMTKDAAEHGIIQVLEFAAILSLNLAVLNALPIPALDGGRFLFLIIEVLRGGKKINKKIEKYIHAAGFALLIILVLFVTVGDIKHFGV